MSSADQIQRLMFEDIPVRGILVGLEETYNEVLSRHQYPLKVASLLGEMLAASSLLASTLKFEGRLSLMAKGTGAVSLLMAECNDQQQMRAIARWEGDVNQEDDLEALLGKGQLVITIEPEKGNRYQGIVPLEKPQLAQCLEDYFAQSEQLPTQIVLAADTQKAAGFMLQVLPGEENAEDTDDWNRVTHLGSTLTSAELLTLDNQTLMHRLYHEDNVRMYDPSDLGFFCDCSRERSLKALQTVPLEELSEVLLSEGEIKMDCQFCNEVYRFDKTDIAAINGDRTVMPPSNLRH